jgi:repressor LexA
MSKDAKRKQATPRQNEVLGYLRQHCRTFGPTVREIGTALKIKSPNGVVAHLRALERKGLIRRTPGISRGIEVL